LVDVTNAVTATPNQRINIPCLPTFYTPQTKFLATPLTLSCGFSSPLF